MAQSLHVRIGKLVEHGHSRRNQRAFLDDRSERLRRKRHSGFAQVGCVTRPDQIETMAAGTVLSGHDRSAPGARSIGPEFRIGVRSYSLLE